MTGRSRFTNSVYIRNVVFGGEDSLVSTVGLLSGIAAGGVVRQDIILTGVVLIFVEALSMGVGSFLSESTAEEYLNRAGTTSARIGAGIMFISYFILGFIPLFPYVILPVDQAFWASILASIAALFLLGWFSGHELKRNVLRSSLKMAILGGSTIAIGVIIGKLIR